MKQVLCCDYRFEWKKEDCWIGAYWRTTPGEFADRFDLWICILPMLPFHYICYYR